MSVKFVRTLSPDKGANVSVGGKKNIRKSMLNIVISKNEFDLIVSGELTEIHKEMSKYYTSRFMKCFGVFGDEDNIREISLMKSSYSHKDEDRRVARCTIKIVTPERPVYVKVDDRYKKKTAQKDIITSSKIRKYDSRYVLKILSLRPFDSSKDSSAIIEKDYELTETETIKNLKKMELCMQRKESGCDQNCSECKFNVIQNEFYKTVISAIAMIGSSINRDYNTGYRAGRKKAYEEMGSFDGLTTPREVINTEGYKPYCQICRSTTAIYSADKKQNVFCGKCGALLDWRSVNSDEDNYERIRVSSNIGYNIQQDYKNYYRRRKAIEDFKKDNKAMSKAYKELPLPPEEAKK